MANLTRQLEAIQTNLQSPNASVRTVKGKIEDITLITSNLALGDVDLVPGKIKAGVVIFGVTGTYETVLTGDSVVANVLAGKTFYKDSSTTKLTGTMANNAGAVACVSASIGAPGILSVIPATGFTDGVDDTSTIDLATVDADLIPGNIKAGVNLLGFAGTYVTPLTGDAAITHVLAGKFFYADDATLKLEGTMANNAGAVPCISASITAGTTLSVIPAEGYTDGVNDTSTIDLTTVDADLVTGNIKAGVTILGVAGKTEVVDTELLADFATASDIALGKKAYVNGVLIVGTHE